MIRTAGQLSGGSALSVKFGRCRGGRLARAVRAGPPAHTSRRRSEASSVDKRAGGTGLISGRKAFQRPMAEGVELLNAIQDVYLDPSVTVA